MRGVDAGPARERVHRGEAAVVILVEVEEVVGAERRGASAPRRAAQRREHLGLADGMAVVEVA